MCAIKQTSLLCSSLLLVAVLGCKEKTASTAGRPATSAEQLAPNETLPPVVLETVQVEVPDAEIVAIASSGQIAGGVVYDIKMVGEGVAHDLRVSDAGQIEAHHTKTLLGMPDAVADAVEKEFPEGRIYEVSNDTEAGQETVQVDLFENGKRYELEFTPDGKLIEQSPQLP